MLKACVILSSFAIMLLLIWNFQNNVWYFSVNPNPSPNHNPNSLPFNDICVNYD